MDDAAARPIGVFDSGVGGLSILREIQALLPAEDIVYLADQGFAPYGDKSLDAVRQRAVAVAAELIDRDCKLVVVACNSASAAALHHLRRLFPDTPFVGMEPALKPAAAHTDRGVIGVLATETTFQGQLYASVLQRHTDGVMVFEAAGKRLAMLVEEGRLDEATTDLEELLGPMLAAGIDTLVLGCTHYPFLAEQIQSVAGPSVRLVDPAPAVARQVRRVLGDSQMLQSGVGDVLYLSTLDPRRLTEQILSLLGIAVTAVSVALDDPLAPSDIPVRPELA